MGWNLGRSLEGVKKGRMGEDVLVLGFRVTGKDCEFSEFSEIWTGALKVSEPFS